MQKIIKVGVLILIMGTLASCSSGGNDVRGIRGVILPHHNLVGNYIDDFYAEIAEGEVGEVERVILLSPNHDHIGYGFMQSTFELDSELELDREFIEKLVANEVVEVGSVGLESEHGVMLHVMRLEKYFPDAKLVPLMISWQTPGEYLDAFVEAVLAVDGLEGTLVVASIDFSHYVTEEVAVRNDQRTVAWLEEWGSGGRSSGVEVNLEEILELEETFVQDTENATAMDSPEALYIFTRLLNDVREVDLWKRTSSASMAGVQDPYQNTSHLFVKVW